MHIELPAGGEARLRALASRQGRDIKALLEEAVQQYLDAAAITDVESDLIAETQAALVAELPPVDEWKRRGP